MIFSVFVSKKANQLLENAFFSFENFSFPKKVNYLLRKYDFSFKNMTYSKRINYLLRKYDFADRTMSFLNPHISFLNPLPAPGNRLTKTPCMANTSGGLDMWRASLAHGKVSVKEETHNTNMAKCQNQINKHPSLPFFKLCFWGKILKENFDVFGRFSKSIALSASAVGCI